MILRRLRLKNYRKYPSLDIEFPTGLIGVVGRNGAGKSTLIEAVAFALYGSEASRTKAKGVRRDSCGTDESCEVELELFVAGEPYRIIRRLKGANETQQAELYRGSSSEPLATQASGVQAAVRKLLGMDYGTFTRSVFSKQKEVDALSDTRPEERRKVIQRMVGVDTITHARDAARVERRGKEAEVEGARRAIEALPGKRDEVQKLAPQIKSARTSVLGKRQAAITAAGTARSARAHLERIDKKRSKHTALEKQATGLSSDLISAVKREGQLREEIGALGEAKAELARLLPQDRAFDRVSRAKEAMDKASGKYGERVQVSGEIRKLLVEKGRFKEALDSARLEVSGLRGATKAERMARAEERKVRAVLAGRQKVRGPALKELGKAESQAKKAAKALAQVRKLGPKGRCPTCYRALGDSFEDIVVHLEKERNQYVAAHTAAKRKVATIDSEIRTANQSIGEAVRQVSKAGDVVRRAGQAKERLSAARDKYARAVKAIRDKRERLQVLAGVRYDATKHRELDAQHAKLAVIHNKVERLRQDVNRILTVRRELRAKTRDIKRLRRRIGAVERRKTALAFDPPAYEAAKNANDGAQWADKATAVAYSDAKGELHKLMEAHRRLHGEVKRLQTLQDRIGKDEEVIRYLLRIEALLDEFRLELINRVRPQIEEHASLLLDQVTSGRYPRIFLDEDYAISIHDGTGAYAIRRFSGGEEDLANLCLRLAISEVVGQRAGRDTSSLVVLDEIFGSQDFERRERILQALARLEAMFQQVILITHVEDIHDRVAHVLRVTENVGGDVEATWA